MTRREAAVLDLPALPPGRHLVVTTDTLVSGVHFPAATHIPDLAHKAISVNLSDLAAMGAHALAVQVQVHGPRAADRWCRTLCRALAARAAALGLAHRVQQQPLRAQGLSVLALGSVRAGQALTRDGARPGDDVWVSGTLGDAGAGLEIATGQFAPGPGLPGPQVQDALRDRLQRPEPRLALGQALVGIAHSAIDLSDGLAGDLGHILERSKVGAEVWLPALPLSEQLLAWAGPERARELALSSGDDYELCFTAPAAARDRVLQAGASGRVPVHRVGRILPEPGLSLLGEQGRTVPLPRAYEHFRETGR